MKLPGSERRTPKRRKKYGTTPPGRWHFYDKQMLDLPQPDDARIHRAAQEMVFIYCQLLTLHGECDLLLPLWSSPGLFTSLDDKTLTYPEYRGNGGGWPASATSLKTHTSGMVFIDFFQQHCGPSRQWQRLESWTIRTS